MAQFRPFAIKTGANVPSGTTQYQNILVGFDFFTIDGNYATQIGSASSFVSGDPITLTFN